MHSEFLYALLRRDSVRCRWMRSVRCIGSICIVRAMCANSCILLAPSSGLLGGVSRPQTFVLLLALDGGLDGCRFGSKFQIFEQETKTQRDEEKPGKYCINFAFSQQILKPCRNVLAFWAKDTIGNPQCVLEFFQKFLKFSYKN